MATDFEVQESSEIDSVSLMTVHLSKGLEFPYVCIIGMEENLFPSSMSLDSREGLEEEIEHVSKTKEMPTNPETPDFQK